MDIRLQHSLALTNSRIQTSPSKQEFFAVKRTPRRLKQSDIITPLP